MYPQNQKLGLRKNMTKIIEDTLESLEKIIESSQRVTLMGDLNCSEVNWRRLKTEVKIHGNIDY